MSPSAEAHEIAAPITSAGATSRLRNLYAVRFVFAAIWAGLLLTQASTLNGVSVTLLVIYPLFDLGAAVYDFRSSGSARPRRILLVNMALSLAATIGLAIAATGDIPDALRVWGAWAVTAGLVQLVVALQRYRLGAQWPMILSGAISVLAGASFIAMASGEDPSLKSLAGYATLGGVFFAVSAIRLRRNAR